MEPENKNKEKVKLITLYDQKRNCEDQFLLSLKLLGEGKYGKVYKATHVDKPDLIFAVKVIQLTSDKVRKECLKQLEIVKHLPTSLNLVKIHQQHLQSQNNLYIFQEFCDGGNMAELKVARNGKPFTEDEAFDIFFQIVNGFLSLRSAGIFHQDIKPQNILKKHNLYKFTDFGISQLVDNYETSIVRKGTLSYMPPQKLKPTNYIPTSKSQIFSLGVTLYEIIFGSHPFLKKRLSDYKSYLKEISFGNLKSVDQLKVNFPEASMCFDRLIRIILRMITLSQGKRLGLEELKDYITNSEPFKSMKVVENKQLKEPQKIQRNYDIIGHSKIFVKDENGLRDSMKASLTSKTADHQIIKSYMQFARQASSFLLQGVTYAKRSNIYELKKSVMDKQMECKETIVRIDYLQFLINFYNDFGFAELAKKYNQMIYLLGSQGQSIYAIQNDVEFIKNQFFKVFMESPIQSKVMLREYLKDTENQVGSKISTVIAETFEEISCVRVNFKDDLMAILFLKDAAKVVQCLKNIIGDCLKGHLVAKQIVSPEIEKAKKIISDFNNAEVEKMTNLVKHIEQKMKDQHEMLYDIESNSDEFQVLDFDDDQP